MSILGALIVLLTVIAAASILRLYYAMRSVGLDDTNYPEGIRGYIYGYRFSEDKPGTIRLSYCYGDLYEDLCKQKGIGKLQIVLVFGVTNPRSAFVNINERFNKQRLDTWSMCFRYTLPMRLYFDTLTDKELTNEVRQCIS